MILLLSLLATNPGTDRFDLSVAQTLQPDDGGAGGERQAYGGGAAKAARYSGFFWNAKRTVPVSLVRARAQGPAQSQSEGIMTFRNFAGKTGRALAMSAAIVAAVSLTAAPGTAYADRGHHGGGGWHGGGGHWGGHRGGGWGGGGVALGLLGGALAG